ncbi:MAG: histone H1 [Phycisphaerales bacterium]
MEAFDRLKQLIAEAEEDVNKGKGGNKAAKVRARKKMQEIKQAAQDVRTGLLDAGEADTPTAG